GRDPAVERLRDRDPLARRDVVRRHVFRGAAVRVGHVLDEVGVRRDAADRALPGVDVAVDESRQHDPPRRVDDGGPVARLELGPDGLDPVAGEEHVADEVPELRIHGQDVAASEQRPPAVGHRVSCRHAAPALGGFVRLFGTATCSQTRIFPWTISKRAAASVPGASHGDAPRAPSRKTAVAKLPCTVIETTRPEHGSPAYHLAISARVRSVNAYGAWITSAGTAKRRARPRLSCAFSRSLQARMTAFICAGVSAVVAGRDTAATAPAGVSASTATAKTRAIRTTKAYASRRR